MRLFVCVRVHVYSVAGLFIWNSMIFVWCTNVIIYDQPIEMFQCDYIFIHLQSVFLFFLGFKIVWNFIILFRNRIRTDKIENRRFLSCFFSIIDFISRVQTH